MNTIKYNKDSAEFFTYNPKLNKNVLNKILRTLFII